jgi:tight adherence protein C
MLLLLALLCIGAAVFFVGEVATYPSRLKAKSVRRATDYGRTRITTSERELVRFRERVLSPAASQLASLPLKLNPRTNVDAIAAKLVAAGLTQRISTSGFLAIKGGATVAGVLVGLGIGALGGLSAAVLLMPVLGVVGFIAPDWVLTMKMRARREAVRGDLPDALDLLAVSVEAGLGFDGAVTKLTEHMEGPLTDEFALMLSEIRVGE